MTDILPSEKAKNSILPHEYARMRYEMMISPRGSCRHNYGRAEDSLSAGNLSPKPQIESGLFTSCP